MPSAQMRSGASPTMEARSKRISPESGLKNPEMSAKRVVLPAPFGPMTAEIDPPGTASEIASVAQRPPKRLVTAMTSSMARPQKYAPHGDAAETEEAVRHERHHQHQQRAVKHEIKTGRLA